MKIINFPTGKQNYGENVNLWKFQISQMNLKIRVFVTTYPNKISIFFHTFYFTFGKVTESVNFEYKEYTASYAKLFDEYVMSAT